MFEVGKAKPPSVVKRFRDTHHMMARLFALGFRTGEVAEKMGYSVSRISILRNSPAFEELVEAYRRDVDGLWRQRQDEYLELTTRAKMIAARMKVDQMEEAEENGEHIPLRTLLAIEGDAADRTGYPKGAVTTNINITLAAQLDRARKRSSRVLKLVESVAAEESLPPTFKRRF